MAMPDLQRLEQLSSTAALGMWANDAILALDRVARGKPAGDADFVLLGEAAAALDAASHERELPDGARPVSSVSLVERALEVAERMTVGKGGGAQSFLADLAEELRGVVQTHQTEDLERPVAFFSALSRQQLAATQSVLNSRQEASWTAGPMTLGSF
ncbi:MAG TPA: hypothetical protein VHS74_13025 [Solirubrobacterales bacterium]|jgi:hypothetical protein|nr:hypothetical protein [Solirubrobacterales bacterium]